MADSADATFASFDIIDENLLDPAKNMFNTLTDDEIKEVNQVVTLLESATSNSLDDFEENSIVLRHKPVTTDKLDRLAGKNNAESTSYQTRWAVSVMKGKRNNFSTF